MITSSSRHVEKHAGVEPVGDRGEGGTRPPTGVKGEDLSLDRADRDDNSLAGAIHGCTDQLCSSRSGGRERSPLLWWWRGCRFRREYETVRDLSRYERAAWPAPPTLNTLTVCASNVGFQHRPHLVGMFGEVLFVVTGQQHRAHTRSSTGRPSAAAIPRCPDAWSPRYGSGREQTTESAACDRRRSRARRHWRQGSLYASAKPSRRSR
jgi:hypothetical protein